MYTIINVIPDGQGFKVQCSNGSIITMKKLNCIYDLDLGKRSTGAYYDPSQQAIVFFDQTHELECFYSWGISKPQNPTNDTDLQEQQAFLAHLQKWGFATMPLAA